MDCVFGFEFWPINVHIYTPAATTTTIISACSKCVRVKKSGKISCCGRGGSWFGNCGSAGNTKLHHTWYEGIQACKTRSQFKITIGQQSNAVPRLKAYNGAGVANSTVIMHAKTFALASTNVPTPMSDKTTNITPAHTPMFNPANNSLMFSPSRASGSTSITVQGCKQLLDMTVRISFFLVVV